MRNKNGKGNTYRKEQILRIEGHLCCIINSEHADSYVAGVPVKLARAVNAKISDKWSSEKVYSDDGTEDTITSYEGTEVEIELASLAPQDRAMLFGQLFENGFLIKSKDDLAPELALGFRTKRRNGKYEFTWLYCGKFGQGLDDEFETQAEKSQLRATPSRAISMTVRKMVAIRL